MIADRLEYNTSSMKITNKATLEYKNRFGTITNSENEVNISQLLNASHEERYWWKYLCNLILTWEKRQSNNGDGMIIYIYSYYNSYIFINYLI